MISSLLMLSLTAFVGCACAVPLTMDMTPHQENQVISDDLYAFQSYQSYVDVNFYGYDIYANVVQLDWDLDINPGEYCDVYGTTINGTAMSNHVDDDYFTDNDVSTWMRNNNGLYCMRFYGGGDGSYQFTFFWKYLNISNKYNDSVFFYVKDVADYNVLTSTYFEQLSSTIGSWSTWDTMYYQMPINSLYGFNTNAYVLNGFQLNFSFDSSSYDDVPTIDFAIGTLYQDDTYMLGWQNGYNQGYSDGYTKGVSDGASQESVDAYNRGLQDGLASAQQGTFNNLFNAIADTPIVFIRSLFNFDLFGMNMFIVIMSLLTGILVIYVIKKVWK